MNRELAATLLSELEERGYSLRVVGQVLKLKPKEPPEDMKDALRLQRNAIFELVLQRSTRAPLGLSEMERLTRLVPHFWRLVRTSDGKLGLLWGVTALGVIASFGPGEPLLTLDSASVQLLGLDDQESGSGALRLIEAEPCQSEIQAHEDQQ